MKRILSLVLVLCMVFAVVPSKGVFGADAVSNSNVFLKQAPGSSNCTHVSAVMMLRRRAFLEGNSNWSSVTVNSTKSVAWSGAGLNWDFTYAGMRVVCGSFSGMTQAQKKSKLISLLNEHPEGVVIYMYGTGKKTHAVLATDYESQTDTLYCADPSSYIAKGRIPLLNAYLTGSTQDERIGNLRMYWYVKSGNCVLTTPVPTPVPHTHSYTYINEVSHPHSEYKYCSCGDKEYSGNKKLIASCSKCYPLGNINVRLSCKKIKGEVTFYRNTVKNATSYTLAIYKDGSKYDTYTMSSDEKSVRGLESGNYSAKLTVKNSNTGEERTVNYDSFEILATYNVSYNANGGSNAPSSQTKIQNDDLTLSSGIPKKEGHIFKGWATSKKATTAKYQPGSVYTKNAKITLYAVWEPETYTIAFDANGGKGELENETITYGDTMRMPNNVIQDYFYLKGWSTDKNAQMSEFVFNMDYTFKANTTLYAVWGQSVWNNEVSPSLEGEGTEENPYKIGTAADLAYLANKVNSQSTTPLYEYYELTDNINLSYYEWVPIGLFGNSNQYFYGSLNGNGFTVSDLYITGANEGYVGLFGRIKESEIKNLTVTGAIEGISASVVANIGGVVGYAENSELDNLSVMYLNMGSITVGTSDYSHMGTVAGYVKGGNISNCDSNDCHIDLKAGKFETGMIAGECNTNITDCSVRISEEGLFSTSATVNAFRMGGLCGNLSGTAQKCTVSAPYMSNNIKTTSTTSVGGLVGYLKGEAKVCTAKFSSANENSMTMSGAGSTQIGGIAGQADANAKIMDCKYDGNSISSATTSGQTSVGGLIGTAVAKTNQTVSISGGQVLSRNDLPKKDGYIATWYTDAAMTNEYDFSKTVTSNMTLYAKWEKGDDTPDIWDGTSKEPAYNASTKTYTITNGEELAWVADVTNGVITSGENFPTDRTFSGYTIELTNDIYLNDISNWENWETTPPKNMWKPIGRSASYSFAGTFVGKGNRILGMYMESKNCGVFGYSTNATIQNIGVENAYINATGDSGAIVAIMKGNVSNCYFSNSIFVDSVSAGADTPCIGGIVGNLKSGNVLHCYNTVSINGKYICCGGIVGWLDSSATVKYSYNKGDLIGLSAGGIAGYSYGSVYDCYNEGNIKYVVVGSIGGIVGKNQKNATVLRCYNRGQVTGHAYTGGIAGESLGTVQYCYNVATIKSDYASTYGGIVGALCGYDSLVSTIYYSYSSFAPLYYISGDEENTSISYVSYKSSSQMKTLSNLTGFSTSYWATNSSINGGYPYLKLLEETYKTYTITAVTDADNSAINRSFAKISGALSGSASQNSNVGGVIGLGSGGTSASSSAHNMITIADSISSTTSGSSYKAYSGYIIGQNTGNKFSFNNAYYNSEMSAESSSSTINTTGTAKSEKTINVAFLTNILGLKQYTSLDDLNKDDSAVWVLKNGELPELYYNCLNDVTVSDDIENGTVTVDKAQAVDGEIVTITAIPSENYVLNKIYVNGAEITGATFIVSGNSDVFATFAEKIPEYTVSITANENASATLVNADTEAAEISMAEVNGAITANDGEEIRVDTTVEEDYAIDAIYVNGEEISDSFILNANSVVTMDVTNISTDITAVTNDAEEVGVYFATLGGSIDDFEGASRYIRYWQTDIPEVIYTTEVIEGGGEYSAVVQNLESNTKYSFQMTENGEIKTFTTYEGEETPEEYWEEQSITTTTYKTLTSTYKFSVESSQELLSEALIVAVYNSNEELIAMKQIECDGDVSYTASFPLNKAIKYAKVFVWNNIDEMIPLGKEEKIEITQ